MTERFDLFPVPTGEAAREARLWLWRAVDAARILGPGEELLDAAFALCDLAAGAPTTDGLVDQAEEAWAVVREGSAYLLLDARSREQEAWSALRIATHLAYRLAERSLAIPAKGLGFILQGEKAELVGRWMVRSQQPARRPLRARLARPASVSAGLWDTWRDAVGSGDQRRMADALDLMRETSPTFLGEDQANEMTWRWLEARPGSVAVALVLAEPASLAMLMQADETGGRRTWVLGLELPPPPMPLDTLTSLMRGSVPGTNAGDSLGALAGWLRERVTDPVGRFLGGAPSAVLWSPGPGLRLVAPGAIWRDVPVAMTTSLALPDLASAPGRRTSTLLVLADPGAAAKEERLDLRGGGVSVLDALAEVASTQRPVRLMASEGEKFGRGLLGDRKVVRDTPASARDVLAEAAEHEIIVLVAHGQVDSLEDAAVLCIDAAGEIDRLDVSLLGQEPDRFAGSTVLLLSCDGGRVGDSLADPGGVAGTLVSAGARCVVAPLWPVRLDAAARVGEAVLKGLAAGEEPWTVLARLQVDGHEDSPMLGGPPPSLSERHAADSLQRLAFVTWVG